MLQRPRCPSKAALPPSRPYRSYGGRVMHSLLGALVPVSEKRGAPSVIRVRIPVPSRIRGRNRHACTKSIAGGGRGAPSPTGAPSSLWCDTIVGEARDRCEGHPRFEPVHPGTPACESIGHGDGRCISPRLFPTTVHWGPVQDPRLNRMPHPASPRSRMQRRSPSDRGKRIL